MAPFGSAPAAEEVQDDLSRLVRLVEESRVEEARRLAPELAERWPHSRELQHLARVLEAPKLIPSRPSPPARRFDRDRQWLREHAQEHPGCWIATLEDRSIAADPSAERVLEIVRAAVDLTSETPLLHYQPRQSE